MDAVTIFVIVATILFVGFIVWVNVCGPRAADAQTPASDSNPQSLTISESTTKRKTVKKTK